MDRQTFLKRLETGALMALVPPDVAHAYKEGNLSQEQLFDLLKDESGGLLVQQGVVIARMRQQIDGKVLVTNPSMQVYEGQKQRPFVTAYHKDTFTEVNPGVGRGIYAYKKERPGPGSFYCYPANITDKPSTDRSFAECFTKGYDPAPDHRTLEMQFEVTGRPIKVG